MCPQGHGKALGGENGAYDCFLKYASSPRADDVVPRLHHTHRSSEDDVAVHGRMNGIYCAGEAVVAHLGDLAYLRLGEARVGSHDPERGVLSPTQTGGGLG